MKIATFNVNSIRRRLDILTAWLQQHKPDVMCLQETKIQDKDFPVEQIEAAGYGVYFRGMKSYNGVATLFREKPDEVLYGLESGPDSEDFRIIQTIHGGIPVINTYIPQGYAAGTDKFAYKLDWFARLRNYFEEHLDPKKPALWVGDLNIAPEPLDVFDPKGLALEPDFHPDARAAFQKTASWGFLDAYRHLNPATVQYTYWDFFRDHFNRNRGWRIDHIMVTEPLVKALRRVEVDLEPRRMQGPSDHTIVWAELDV